MALMSPVTYAADVDRHSEAFGEAVGGAFRRVSAERGSEVAAPGQGSPPRRAPVVPPAADPARRRPRRPGRCGDGRRARAGGAAFAIAVAVILGIAPWAAIIDEQERPRRRWHGSVTHQPLGVVVPLAEHDQLGG